MNAKKTLTALLAASFFTLPALAQPSSAPEAQKEQRAEKRADRAAKKKAMVRKIRMRALEQAGVSQPKAARAIAIMESNDGKRQETRAATRKHKKALNELIRSGSSDDAAFRAALDGLVGAQKAHFSIRDQERKQLGRVLQPSEYAKTVVNLKKARKQVAKKRGDRKRGPKRGRTDRRASL